MLNEEEKEEFRRLLRYLPEKELILLKDTITSKLIKTHSLEETIESILNHTESASELLSRKKISRSCLFQYLANKKVSIPGNASKSDLVDKFVHSLPSAVAPEVKFRTQLEQLASIGFVDREANIRALTATDGLIQPALARLIGGAS